MDNNYNVTIPANVLAEIIQDLELLKFNQQKIIEQAKGDKGIEYLTNMNTQKINNIGNYLGNELGKQRPVSEREAEMASMFK
jgi:hypothetical protein